MPGDSRALAGYVEAKGGTLDISVDVSHLSSGNTGMAKSDTHVDLFVYNAESPGTNGAPKIVASAMGMDGSANLSVDVSARDFEGNDTKTRTFYVVAKLVNVPGAVTGYNIQANLDIDLAFKAADIPIEPPETVDLNVSGTPGDEGSVFTSGQSDRVTVTVKAFNGEMADAVSVTDQVPGGWTVDPEYGDVDEFDGETGEVTFTRDVAQGDLGTDAATLEYFAEALSGASSTGRDTFGPAEAEAVDPATFEDHPDREQGSTSGEFGGTDTNTVVGASIET